MKKLLIYVLMSCIMPSVVQAQTRHVVQRGESFELIASRYGLTVDELKRENPDEEVCYTGLELVIPKGSEPKALLGKLTSYEASMIDQASQLYQHGKYRKAASVYSEVLKTYPSAVVYLGRAMSFYHRKKYKDAISDFNSALLCGDCSSEIREECEGLISSATSLREQQREKRNKVWQDIGIAAASVAVVAATAYAASEQSKAQQAYMGRPYPAAGAGSSHLSRADAIIAQSNAHINQMMASGNLQLQQISQATMAQGLRARDHIIEVNREQLRWASEFKEKNGRYPTEAESDMWLFQNHHDVWLLSAQAKAERSGDGSGGSSDDSGPDEEYKGELSPSQYEASYRRWESRVQDILGSLTIGGYEYKDKDGEIRGKTSKDTKGWAYVGFKSQLRNAQENMRKIRLEAARYGVNIQQSKWETATASY